MQPGCECQQRDEVKMIQAVVLDPLLKLLRSPNVHVQEQTYACLESLSVNNDNTLKLIEEGDPGIRGIVSLLVVQDLAVQEHVCGALGNCHQTRRRAISWCLN